MIREHLSRLLLASRRISVRLYVGIGFAVAFTAFASLVGWFSFNRVGNMQSMVNEYSVPEMEAAFAVVQQSGALVAAAPRLTAADVSSFADVAARVDAERDAFELLLAELRDKGETYERIRGRGAELIANTEAIKESVQAGFELAERSEAVRAELAALESRLAVVLTTAIDDQLFYAMTGYRDLDQPEDVRAQHFSTAEFDRYRHLASLRREASIATQLLASAFSMSDSPLIEPLRERFEAAIGGIERSLAALAESSAGAAVEPLFARLAELGVGEEGGFDMRTSALRLVDRQRELVERNHDLEVDLVAHVESYVGASRASVDKATSASTEAILAGRQVLLGLNVVSIVGAVLIAWLFVGGVILRRIDRLSDRMRRMADGDLEAEVDISGDDEVAEMADALEIFRRHALEVQRLNLVEKLAEELKEKNAAIEQALADLREAQDQIIASQKLAELGELTAGVAHEIKNPLNFVKNFAEASSELIEELKETLDESAESMDEEQRGLIDEICQDLVENFERIGGHGDRADRIVRDMLRMGRSSAGERQPTDINTLLEEHVRLAFHSARANDENFQLDIQEDFDPDAGEIDVVPQDLGRVFLNMVGNACDATNERRMASDDDYRPTLAVSTRRMEDAVEIRVRDNGTGMPQEVVDKIFNPFFTTKPTDRGNGLGLAISSDIVRQHGGTIRVESEQGSHTEMIIDIPRVPPALEARVEESETESGVAD